MKGFFRQLRLTISDWLEEARRFLRGLGMGLRESFGSVGDFLASIPEGIGAFFKAIGSIPAAIGRGLRGLFADIRQAPGQLSGSGKSVARSIGQRQRDLGQAIKGTGVQLREEPQQAAKRFSFGLRTLGEFFQRQHVAVRVLIVFFAVLFLGALIGIVPIYRAVESWRVERFLEEAEVLAADGDYEQANDLARAAYALIPDHVPTLRFLAEYGRALDDPRALDYARRVLLMDVATEEDLVQFGELAIAEGQAGGLLPYLALYREGARESARLAVIYARQRLGSRPPEALEVLQYWVDRDTDILDVHVLYVLASLESPDPARQEAGRAHLREMLGRDDAIGLNAYGLYINLPSTTMQEKVEAMQRLREHPLFSLRERLFVLAFEINNGLTDFEEIEPRLGEWFDMEDPESLLQLAQWLSRLGQGERFLDYVDFEQVRENEDLLLAYFEALLQAGQANRVLALIDEWRGQLPLRPPQVWVAEAQALRRLGREEAFLSTIRLALDSAELQDYNYLERLVTRLDNEELQVDFYRMVARNPITAAIGRANLLRLAYEQGRTELIEDLLPRMSFGAYQAAPAVLNLLVYLKALYEPDRWLVNARSLSEALVSDNPDELDYRVTLAFLYHLSGFSEAGVYVLGEDWRDDSRLNPSEKAVVALILWQNGQKEDALRLVGEVYPGELLPQENALIEHISEELAQAPAGDAL